MKSQMVSLLVNIGNVDGSQVLLPSQVPGVMASLDLTTLDMVVTGYHLKDVDSGMETMAVLFDAEGHPYASGEEHF